MQLEEQKKQLTALTLVSVLALLLLGAASVFAISGYRADRDRALEVLTVRHARIANATKTMADLDLALYEAMENCPKLSDEDYVKLNVALQNYSDVIATFKGSTSPENTKIIKDGLEKLTTAYDESFIPALKRGDIEQVLDTYNGALSPVIVTSFSSLGKIVEAQMSTAASDLRQSSSLPFVLVIILLAAGIVAVLYYRAKLVREAGASDPAGAEA